MLHVAFEGAAVRRREFIKADRAGLDGLLASGALLIGGAALLDTPDRLC